MWISGESSYRRQGRAAPPRKGGASIGREGVMTPHLFWILVFLLYSIVNAQCIDPPSPT